MSTFTPLLPAGGAERLVLWAPRGRSGRVSRSVPPVWRRLLDGLLHWQKRAAARRAMLQMSDHILKDIGLTRAELRMEAEQSTCRD